MWECENGQRRARESREIVAAFTYNSIMVGMNEGKVERSTNKVFNVFLLALLTLGWDVGNCGQANVMLQVTKSAAT